jgi:hypothetical protein
MARSPHKGDGMEHTGFLVGSLDSYIGQGALHIPLAAFANVTLTEAVRGMRKGIFPVKKKCG